MIAIDERLEIPASSIDVWKVISDPEAVVTCIDGASLGEFFDDGSFSVGLTVKFGPMRVKFAGKATLVLQNVERVGELSASGTDGQGATRARAKATFEVADGGERASVLKMIGCIELSGKLASLIESGAGVVVRRMTEEFTKALSKRCGSEVEDTDIPVTSVEPRSSTGGWMRTFVIRVRNLLRRGRSEEHLPRRDRSTLGPTKDV